MWSVFFAFDGYQISLIARMKHQTNWYAEQTWPRWEYASPLGHSILSQCSVYSLRSLMFFFQVSNAHRDLFCLKCKYLNVTWEVYKRIIIANKHEIQCSHCVIIFEIGSYANWIWKINKLSNNNKVLELPTTHMCTELYKIMQLFVVLINLLSMICTN